MIVSLLDSYTSHTLRLLQLNIEWNIHFVVANNQTEAISFALSLYTYMHVLLHSPKIFVYQDTMASV